MRTVESPQAIELSKDGFVHVGSVAWQLTDDYRWTVSIACAAFDTVAALADDAFEALCLVREQLEPHGWRIGVIGAQLGVWPSGMERDQGGGKVAYRQEGGQVGDLVDTFEPVDPSAVTTVAEQQAEVERQHGARMRARRRITHVEQRNAARMSPLDASPTVEALRATLGSMDGSSRWAYALWRAPVDLDPEQEMEGADEYMQCTGSGAAMMVEVRFVDADGTGHQYAIGRAGADGEALTETFRWNDDRHESMLRPSEVLTAGEAAEIFAAYGATDGVVEPWVLRELDLRWPLQADEEPGDDEAGVIMVELSRHDAQPGDQERTETFEVSARLPLSALLTRVIEPFLTSAPRTRWVCRGMSRGTWRDFAEVVTFGPPDRLGTGLLVRDHSIRSFIGASEGTLRVACRAPLQPRDPGTGAARLASVRPLLFSDGDDVEQRWAPGDERSAQAAFWDFARERQSAGSLALGIEDEERDEGIVLMLGADAVARVKSEPESVVEYRTVPVFGDYLAMVSTFVSGGYAALDRHGTWLTDEQALSGARLRTAMDESSLRRTHPHELRRRLAVLTHIDGREPATVDGITHSGYAHSDGSTVDAWFTADCRGLVVTNDRTSPLGASTVHALTVTQPGLPRAVLARAGNAPATGVFTFAGPCALADGLVAPLAEAGLGLAETGLERLVDPFLEIESLTPEAVASAGWWSADDIDRGFGAAAPRAAALDDAAPLAGAAVDVLRRVWAATGYFDRWNVHWVLFDSCTLEQAGEARGELLQAIETLGLELVDSPSGSADGEVWVRADARIGLGADGGIDAASIGEPLVDIAIRALLFPWSEDERRMLRSPPYPLPAQLRGLVDRLEAALPIVDPTPQTIGSYVPSSTFHGRRVMARAGLPRVVLDLVTHRTLTRDDGERLIEAAARMDLSATDRDLVVRSLRLRLVEASLMADDVVTAQAIAAAISGTTAHLGWREIAAYHAARGDAAAFLRGWSHYDAGRDRAQLQRLKTRLVRAVAGREGWQAGLEVVRDSRIGDAFRVHAFEPPAYGYDDLLTLFGGDAAGVLAEADELHCLVAAAVAESRPRPLADHHGVDQLLARVAAIDADANRESMRVRDRLLSTLRMAIGSDETLARLRAQIRTPRLRAEAMHLFVGQVDDPMDGAP